MDSFNANEIKILMECVSSEDDILKNLWDDSDDEGNEEEVFGMIRQTLQTNRNCIRNYLEVVVPTYTEKEFVTHFRLKPSVYENLCKRYEASEEFKKLRRDKRVSAHKSTAVFLWFAGHEACSFRDVGDRFDLSISTVSVIIERLTMFISSLSPEIIRWPNNDQKEQTCGFFKNKAGFSKAIDCIDGTHVLIDPPIVSKDEYIDRKGLTSICVQAICNEKKKFTNVFVGFPGSCHDSWVFRNSPIYEKLNSSCGDYYLLGDSAYPCTNNLVTPYRDNGHLTNDQKRFNVRLSSCRVAIEHSFGILKQRFRQLYYCKLRGIKKICHFIRACCVLHNIAGEDDMEFELEALQEPPVESVQERRGEISKGNIVRDVILQEMKRTQ